MVIYTDDFSTNARSVSFLITGFLSVRETNKALRGLGSPVIYRDRYSVVYFLMKSRNFFSSFDLYFLLQQNTILKL